MKSGCGSPRSGSSGFRSDVLRWGRPAPRPRQAQQEQVEPRVPDLLCLTSPHGEWVGGLEVPPSACPRVEMSWAPQSLGSVRASLSPCRESAVLSTPAAGRRRRVPADTYPVRCVRRAAAGGTRRRPRTSYEWWDRCRDVGASCSSSDRTRAAITTAGSRPPSLSRDQSGCIDAGLLNLRGSMREGLRV